MRKKNPFANPDPDTVYKYEELESFMDKDNPVFKVISDAVERISKMSPEERNILRRDADELFRLLAAEHKYKTSVH